MPDDARPEWWPSLAVLLEFAACLLFTVGLLTDRVRSWIDVALICLFLVLTVGNGLMFWMRAVRPPSRRSKLWLLFYGSCAVLAVIQTATARLAWSQRAKGCRAAAWIVWFVVTWFETHDWPRWRRQPSTRPARNRS